VSIFKRVSIAATQIVGELEVVQCQGVVAFLVHCTMWHHQASLHQTKTGALEMQPIQDFIHAGDIWFSLASGSFSSAHFG